MTPPPLPRQRPSCSRCPAPSSTIRLSWRSPSPRSASWKPTVAPPSPIRCSCGPASPAPTSRPVPTGRSSAASTATACARRRTASARTTCRRSPRTTPFPSIRSPPTASRSCAARRRCATAARPSAASSRWRTSAFRHSYPAAASPAASSAAIHPSTAAPTAPSAPRPGQAASPSMPMRSSAMPTTTSRRAARCSTVSSTAKAPRSALRSIGTDGFVGVSYTRFASLYGIPGEEAEEGVVPRIDMEQDKVQAKGEWRVRDSGIEAIRFWFGASDYGHDELAVHDPDNEPGVFELGSRFTNREQEARVEIQHLPSDDGPRRADGRGRRPRRQPQDARTELRGGFAARAGAHAKRRRLLVRGAGADRGAARAGGGTHRAHDGRRQGWSDVTDPDAPVVFAGERAFTPVSGGLGLLYALAVGTSRRASTASMSSARPMPPSCSPRACTRQPGRSRSATRSSTRRRPRPPRSA